MSDFIPLVTAPYQDEFLFSWVKRLAALNMLPIDEFFRKYSGKKSLGKQQILPVDIRRGYFDLYEASNCNVDRIELYLQLSTTQFELMFYPQKQQINVLHQITRPESKLNTITKYFVRELHVCKECMQEDMEKYGEYYFHRSHQLSGVCVCHKHHTKLYTVNRYKGKKDHKQIHNFDDLTEMVNEITDYDMRYANYAYELMTRNICSCSSDILTILFDKVKEDNPELMRKQFAEIMANILNNAVKKDKWSRIDGILPPNEAIKIIMHYFPDVDDFISRLKPYNLIIKKHCNKCNKDYYTTQYAIETGWGCSCCDHLLGEEKLFKRLVQVGGNNEYKMMGKFQAATKKVLLYHKTCGEEFWVEPRNFIFLHTRCNCNQRLIRKDAEKKMKAFPHFKLIEFSGMVQPVTLKHDICGEEFTISSFRDFLDTPKCRCCEIPKDVTQEIFEQEVRDVVGDEYTVIGQVKTRNDKVKIRHNTCGCVTEFKVYDFLDGSRCPHCYCKASVDRIKQMLLEYADDRYTVVGHDNYRTILYDNETKKELKMRNKRIVQEMLRPTPSSILPTHKECGIEQALTTWDAWYKLCIEFKQEFGHLAVGRDQKYKGKLLGDWCSMQRIAFNKGELPDENFRLLKEIDFVFDMVFYYWNQRFEEYKDYVKETGNYFPPVDCIHNGNKVGQWFLGQRKERKKGKLNPRYEAILLEYNPEFFKERNAWDTRYARMK